MNWGTKRVSNYLLLVALSLCAPLSVAQYTITSIAGGGPNQLPPLQSSIGYSGSIAFDGQGNAYIADSFSSQVFKISNGTLTVFAGNGTYGYSGDGGHATSAQLASGGPNDVFVDGNGNVFIADRLNSVIREVTTDGIIHTVAGNGTPGYSGDGGSATSAHLFGPRGVSVDTHGNIFIADTENNVIREVSNGTIQTVAGNFAAGMGYSGDSGPATAAQLNGPQGIAVDALGNIFIADTSNFVIREVTASNGNIQTIAGVQYAFNASCLFSGDGGPATAAQFCYPSDVLLDGNGNLYITDEENSVIRVVNTGTQPLTVAGITIPAGFIQTIAGTPDQTNYAGDGGPATSAFLTYPTRVALDGSGNIFIADVDNYVIREVDASTGTISTYAGNHTLAYSGDGAPVLNASLHYPNGAATDPAGNIYIADTYNQVIRVMNPGSAAVSIAGVTIQPGTMQTIAGNGASCLVPAAGGCGDGGPGTSAQLSYPSAVFVDSTGLIYVADTGLLANGDSAIRVVNPGSAPVTIAGVTINPGTIQTVAGTLGSTGFLGDGGAPTSAQLYDPTGVAVDSAGNIFIADETNSAIRVVNTGTQPLVIGGVTVAPGTINTVAGTPPNACTDPSAGCGDNGAANLAALNNPFSVSVDAADNIYIADASNSVIRVVNSSAQPLTIAGTTVAAGNIATIAGTMGRNGYSGDNGPPTSAFLNTPLGVWVDALGNVYISDTNNDVIREVVGVASTIQTIAGTGVSGFSGDGGSATSAQLSGPQSVAVGPSGALFLTDTQNARIRRVVSNVSVAIVPGATTLALGGTQQFVATVTGTGNTAVTWQVNGVTGGNATLGTVTAGGLYQAPANAPTSAVNVDALSNANGTTSGSAPVTLAAAGGPAISVSTNPSGVTVVYTSTTQAFIATVTGETNTAVNWSVNGIAGGNSIYGTIDNTGIYTAPAAIPSPALFSISAVSQADATVSASYPISIAVVPAVAQPPAPQTISAGGTANFSMSLSGGSPQSPIALSCKQSTLPQGGVCTFTPPTITPGSANVGFSLSVSVPARSAAAEQHTPVWLATGINFAFAPIAGILLLAGTLRKRSRWLGLIALSVFVLTLVACGGGGNSHPTPSQPVTYHIQVQGTSAAQPNPVAITTVTLTVQ